MNDITLKIAIDGKEANASLRLTDENIEKIRKSLGQFNDEATTKTNNFFGKLIGLNQGFELLRNSVSVLSSTFGGLIGRYEDQAKAVAKVEAVLRATGGASGLTAEELGRLSSELAKNSQFEDEAILNAQGLLLTFKEIGGEQIPRVTQAVMDLSATFDQDLSSSAIQLGKALQDPATGISALRRVGVSFSDDQENMIKALATTNRLAEAQAIILREVESQVKGADASMANANGILLFKKSISEIQETLGGMIVEGLNPVLSATTKFLQELNNGHPTLTKFAGGVVMITGALVALNAVGITTGVLSLARLVASFSLVTVAGEGFVAGIGKATIAVSTLQAVVGGLVVAIGALAYAWYNVWKQTDDANAKVLENIGMRIRESLKKYKADIDAQGTIELKVRLADFYLAEEKAKLQQYFDEVESLRAQGKDGDDLAFQIAKKRFDEENALVEGLLAKKREAQNGGKKLTDEEIARERAVSVEVQKIRVEAMKDGVAKNIAQVRLEFETYDADLKEKVRKGELLQGQADRLRVEAEKKRDADLKKITDGELERTVGDAKDHEKRILQIRTEGMIADLDAQKEVALAKETNEARKLEIVRRFELEKIAVVKESALKEIEIEEAKARAIADPVKREKVLAELADRKTSVGSTASSSTAKVEGAYTAGTSGIAPADSIQGHENAIAEIQKKIAVEVSEAKRAELQKQIEAHQEAIAKMKYTEKEFAKDAVRGAGDVVSAWIGLQTQRVEKDAENKRREIETRQTVDEDALEAEKQKVLATATTAEQRTAIEKRFEAKRKEMDAKYAQEKKVVAMEEFKQKQALARIQAIMNIATAVTMALASAPPPFNFILAGLSATAGAVQLAIINEQQPPAFAFGGRVSGPGGPRDDRILARLSDGEFVVNADATRKNLGLLEAINSGGRRFASGGSVGSSSRSGVDFSGQMDRVVEAIRRLQVIAEIDGQKLVTRIEEIQALNAGRTF